MAKKKIKDFDVTVDTEKVDVHVKKKGSDFDVDVKTQKVEVELKSEGENKTFKMDGKKIDVHVEKTEAGTTVEVVAENGFLQKIGKFISNIFVKKFNKNK